MWCFEDLPFFRPVFSSLTKALGWNVTCFWLNVLLWELDLVCGFNSRQFMYQLYRSVSAYVGRELNHWLQQIDAARSCLCKFTDIRGGSKTFVTWQIWYCTSNWLVPQVVSVGIPVVSILLVLLSFAEHDCSLYLTKYKKMCVKIYLLQRDESIFSTVLFQTRQWLSC